MPDGSLSIDAGGAKALVSAAAVLTLAAGAFAGRRLFGAPFAFGLLCEGLMLAAIAAMSVSMARRLWLILAMGTIYLQPRLAERLGAAGEQSYALSCSLALVAAAAGLRERFRFAAFALAFLTGWLDRDFILAPFFGALAIRWLVHCRDASGGGVASPLRKTGLDGLSAGGGMGLAILIHILLNRGHHVGLAAAAASAGVTPMTGDIFRSQFAALFAAGWTYPSQFALLCAGIMLVAAGSRRISLEGENASRLGIFSICVLFCVSGWALLMPVLALASVMLPDALIPKRSAGRSPAANSGAFDAAVFRSFWLPALKICGTLGILFSILNIASRWRAASGPTLVWGVFLLFGLLLSGWALVTRLKWHPAISDSRSRLTAALLIGLSCLSVYALYCIGAEILFSRLSGFTLFLIAITAAAVVAKHELERKSLGASGRPGPRAATALALVLFCGIAWLETGRLMWWEQFNSWISGGGTVFLKASFFCVLAPTLLLWDYSRSTGLRRKGLMALDILAVLVLFIFSFEKDLLLRGAGDYNYPVFIAPVDYIRSGGHLLWDVPSEYGFLNILLVSMLKPFRSAEALYLVNSTLIFMGTLVSYFAFRLAWPALGAPLVGIPFILGTSLFLPGWAPKMWSLQAFPSDSPFRFLFCYALILLLLLQQLSDWKERLPLRRVMWVGNCLWLLGCLWSAESLAFCSALWFPALLLIDGQMRHEDFSESPARTFIHSLKLLRLPVLLLGGAAAVLSLGYLLRIGHLPDFRGYFDYVFVAGTNGFYALPRTPDGADHWSILFFFSTFSILVFSVKPAQKPLAAAALFCCWAVSSYYAGRSHPQNVLNLIPVFVLALNIFIFILRDNPIRGEWDLFARSIARALSLALISFTLIFVFNDPSLIAKRALGSLRAMRLPFSTPGQPRWMGTPDPFDGDMADETNASEIQTSLAAALRKNFNQADAPCVISLVSYWQNDTERQELWVPFLSPLGLQPLSSEARTKYLNRFMARVNSSAPNGKCAERWLAYNDLSWTYVQWELESLQKIMRTVRKIDSGSWHLVNFSSRGQ